MILVSSGNIAHEISGKSTYKKKSLFIKKQVTTMYGTTGLTKFEDNLLNQINNQEAIIETLKGRLEAKDKQVSP